jgi:hypothetical protein
MGAYEHEGLRVDVDHRVAFVTIDHPPVNLFDAVLIGSLGELAGELAEDDDVGALVVRSADPEFFIAHADLGLIQALPRDRTDRPEQPEFIHVFMERWRTLPQVTIAQLEGARPRWRKRVRALPRPPARGYRAGDPRPARGRGRDRPGRERYSAAPAPHGEEPRARSRARVRGLRR